jgi:hypothetical protein
VRSKGFVFMVVLPPSSVKPHPEEPRSGVSKYVWHQRGLMVRDGAARLLTMRA